MTDCRVWRRLYRRRRSRTYHLRCYFSCFYWRNCLFGNLWMRSSCLGLCGVISARRCLFVRDTIWAWRKTRPSLAERRLRREAPRYQGPHGRPLWWRKEGQSPCRGQVAKILETKSDKRMSISPVWLVLTTLETKYSSLWSLYIYLCLVWRIFRKWWSVPKRKIKR